MTRMTYKTALRAKGIKPLPPYHKLRSERFADDDQWIDATASAMQECGR